MICFDFWIVDFDVCFFFFFEKDARRKIREFELAMMSVVQFGNLMS